VGAARTGFLHGFRVATLRECPLTDPPPANRQTSRTRTDATRWWSELELRPEPSAWDTPGIADHPERPPADRIRLPPDRLAHILDGDEDGGGHLYGTGSPGKCEFPEEWDESKIESVVLHTAYRPQFAKQQANGLWAVSRNHDRVEVWAVMRPDGRIWTAYPDGKSPGVTRNPRTRDG
jgi:hypothetical protein